MARQLGDVHSERLGLLFDARSFRIEETDRVRRQRDRFRLWFRLWLDPFLAPILQRPWYLRKSLGPSDPLIAKYANSMQAGNALETLTDFEWRMIAPLLPNKHQGVPRGGDWWDLPERYGTYTIYCNRSNRRRKKGMWAA